MSENDDSHYAGTTKVAAMSSRKGTPEEESLQASLKDRHRGCRRDMLSSSSNSIQCLQYCHRKNVILTVRPVNMTNVELKLMIIIRVLFSLFKAYTVQKYMSIKR